MVQPKTSILLSLLLGLHFLLRPTAVSVASAAETCSALVQLIEKAKREGVVDAALPASLTERGARAVAEGIRQKYGVDLKINYTPSQVYAQISAQAVTEHKTGVPPSYDLVVGDDSAIFPMARAGALEQVDWLALLPAGTPKETIVYEKRALVVFTAFAGLLYDPKKISAKEAPSSLRQLADPKWKGKVIVSSYPTTWLRQLRHLGREESLSQIKAIMKNGAMVQTWPAAFTRFTAGEYPMVAMISDTFYYAAKKRGISAAFKPHEIPALGQHCVGVRTGAKHPNAAKLLAAFLAGPEAVRIWQEVASNVNAYYPALIPSEYRLSEW